MDDDHELYEVHQHPELDQPVLVLAPDGWIDAGIAGSGALAAIMGSTSTEVVATFDSDELIDYRARRPVSLMEDGVYKDFSWPGIELRHGRDADGQDLLILVGPEPDSRWQAFTAALADLAATFGVRMLVGLGGFPAPVPHTRTIPLVATASSEELVKPIGVVPGRLQVPAGIMSALAEGVASAGIPAVGLWARVPHYAAGMPYPDASLQLLDGILRLTGLRFEVDDLREEADETRRKLDELAANSSQHRTLVSQLESQFDAEAEVEKSLGGNWASLPSGDELAAELERFLRDESP